MPTSILIADDYDDNRELLRLMLENAGYAVREARDGREFVDAARAEPPDVALIDLSMPVLDGWRALSELRSDARTRSLPCVAVTAFAAEIDRQRAFAAGFDAYVTKPFRSTDLVEVVERLLKGGARDADSSTPRDGDAHSRAKEIGGTNDGGRG
jgi:two-component system cell cycle response regulator DivK